MVELASGEAMTVCESRSIAAGSRAHLILFAGAVDCGKTTLIASLFHCFQRGPLGGYLFAGSRTLIGFDQRCHDARIASKRRVPAMQRTRFGDTKVLLHLKVAPQSAPDASRHLLFADISGESFEDAVNSVDDCANMPLLRRADHFVLLIDGEKVVSRDCRQGAKRDALMLLQCCIDAQRLGKRSLVDVVLTKCDLIGGDESAIAFVRSIQQSVESRFASTLGRLRFFHTAVRPEIESAGIRLGHGLNELFPSWVDENPDTLFPSVPFQRSRGGCCEFDRFSSTLP